MSEISYKIYFDDFQNMVENASFLVRYAHCSEKFCGNIIVKMTKT